MSEQRAPMHRIYIGVGSNLEPIANIRRALRLLADEFSGLKISPAYRSSAVGGGDGEFVNLVVSAETERSVRSVVTVLKSIEVRCGRTPEVGKTSQHSIDLDLLSYGDLIIDDNGLSLPRADIERYAFVLKPLADLAPDAVHPRLHETYRDMWESFSDPSQVLSTIEVNLEP